MSIVAASTTPPLAAAVPISVPSKDTPRVRSSLELADVTITLSVPAPDAVNPMLRVVASPAPPNFKRFV